MIFLTTFCLMFLSQTAPSESLRILVAFPMPATSHDILGQGVVRHLLEAGHEVVYITPYPQRKQTPGLKELDISSIGIELKKEMSQNEDFKLKNLMGKRNIGDSSAFLYLTSYFHKKFMQSDIMKNFLADPNEKFDVVILEWFFSEITVGIPILYQCPLVWVGTTEAHGLILRVIDELPNPTYNADLFSTKIPPFTFWERLSELWIAAKRQYYNYIISFDEKSLYNTIYPELALKKGVTLPPFEEAVYNGTLMFINSHPSIGSSYRLPQSVKYVGGFHVETKVKPLPEELQKLMNESKHGVIYFSMGSNLKSMDMTDKMKKSLLDLFGKLKHDVIWKFEGDLNDVPSNVHLLKWAPQQSILSHPNLKLFITHGGQLSTTESIHFGVPVIGIPVLGDQYVNMEAVERKGFGIMVKLAEDMAVDLEQALDKVLNDPEYTKKAKYLSSVYHDRPVHPGKELVHWVEHVVKTRGAPHLRSPALMLAWYQKIYLDAILLLIVVVCLLRYGLGVMFMKNKGGKVKSN